MLNTNRSVLSMMVVMLLGSYPQFAVAEEFTSAQFLAWPAESQHSYIHTSIGMAGLIVSLRDKPKARCVENWYVGDTAAAEAAILEAMRRFPTYNPRGVIVAVLQKQCGSLAE